MSKNYSSGPRICTESSKIFYWVDILSEKYCCGQWGALNSKMLRLTALKGSINEVPD